MVKRGPKERDEEVREAVISLLEEAEGGLNFNELFRRLKGKGILGSFSVLSNTLKILKSREEVDIDEVPGPGIPRKVYRLSKANRELKNILKHESMEMAVEDALSRLVLLIKRKDLGSIKTDELGKLTYESRIRLQIVCNAIRGVHEYFFSMLSQSMLPLLGPDPYLRVQVQNGKIRISAKRAE